MNTCGSIPNIQGGNGEDWFYSDIVKDYDFSLTTFSTYVEDYVKSINKLDEYKVEKARQKAKRNKEANRETYKIIRIDKSDPSQREVFPSLREAARALGKSSSGPISNVLAGRTKSAYGYFWERT